MDNPVFANEENIQMVEKDYDDYSTPNTSRIDETSFAAPSTTEATSILRLRQKVKRDKLNALYRHLNLTGNPDLIDLNRFRVTKDLKKGVTIFELHNGDRWAPLTKETGDFLASKTLRDRFSGVITMKNFLGIDRTPPAP